MPVLESPPLAATNIQKPVRREPSRLDLRFTASSHGTQMLVSAQQPPWRVIRAFPNAQRQAVVHLHNVSGGILSGDSLHLAIEAGPSTRVQLTSVGATRIYRHRSDRAAARLSTSIAVEAGAIVEYLPDVIIPFAGSRLLQSTNITLGANSGFIGWETLAAGRIASGEEFAFDLFRSEFSIQSETRPLAIERYSLEPSAADPRSVARWGRFRYTAALHVCHTGIEPRRWLQLETCLNEIAMVRTSNSARWGVSTLVAGGLVIRGLALEAHQISAGLYAFWDRAKQELWGEPALPPRKIN